MFLSPWRGAKQVSDDGKLTWLLGDPGTEAEKDSLGPVQDGGGGQSQRIAGASHSKDGWCVMRE